MNTFRKVYTKIRPATKMRLLILVLALVAVLTTGSVGVYAMTVRTDEIASQTVIADQQAVIKANTSKIETLVASQTKKDESSGDVVAATPASSSTPASSQTQTPKKTYYSTDGLTGNVTSYTEGCVTKRPGYPDPDCDARAGAAVMPKPTVPSTPTTVIGVRPGFNAINSRCSSITAASAYFDLSDARGGLLIQFHFEFDGNSPLLSDGSTPVTSQTYSLTSHNEPTAPYLQGFDSWYDNSAIWLMGYVPSHKFRVHVTSPVDMTSDWKNINFDYNC